MARETLFASRCNERKRKCDMALTGSQYVQRIRLTSSPACVALARTATFPILLSCRSAIVSPLTNAEPFRPSTPGTVPFYSLCVTFVPMRIIAGKYRSRILKSLKGLALRPTSDRLRETLFNVLGPAVAGSRFLDVFAGTGAVGIEALSRGATEAIFIENHAPAAKLIRQNLDSLKITFGCTILAADALSALEKLAARHTPSNLPIDFIFVDPPYAN